MAVLIDAMLSRWTGRPAVLTCVCGHTHAEHRQVVMSVPLRGLGHYRDRSHVQRVGRADQRRGHVHAGGMPLRLYAMAARYRVNRPGGEA